MLHENTSFRTSLTNGSYLLEKFRLAFETANEPKSQQSYRNSDTMRSKLLLLVFIVGFVHGDFIYETKTIQVPIDHFSFTENYTFALRYLYNDTFFDSRSGPIFFYTGNEGDINSFAQNTGFMWEIAPQFNALIVFGEHRYYGESLPFGNDSFKDIQKVGYLTSAQALFDYVYLLDHIQSSIGSRHPVIAFGGSYGGMLSAWLRMKYPSTVQGAIAASAPVIQVQGSVPCGIFNRIVTQDFKMSGDGFDCSEPIRNSWKEIRSMGSTEEGSKWLTETFQLCKPIKDKEDIDLLVQWLTDSYGEMAMVNYPYAANFLGPMPPYPITEACKRLKTAFTQTGKPLIQAIQSAISVFSNYTGQTKCIDTNSEDLSGVGLQGWDFQACTEMIMPMCSSPDDMFETESWNFTDYSEECFKKWGVRIPDDRHALLEYGNRDLSHYSNIIFSNGLWDPWSGGGVLRNVSRSVLAVIIPEGAHHLDLRSSDPADPVSVLEAREFHKRYIGKWIEEFYGEEGEKGVFLV